MPIIDLEIKRDVYGFLLDLTPVEEGARLRAEENQSQQARKWNRYGINLWPLTMSLPKESELKSLCRKVCPAKTKRVQSYPRQLICNKHLPVAT